MEGASEVVEPGCEYMFALLGLLWLENGNGRSMNALGLEAAS